MQAFYNTAWVIYIYAFLGWCCEVVFAACKKGVFVNRGFLNGPVCPIYGFGVALVLWLLEPVKESFILLFLGSMLVTTALEFFIGFVLETFFRDKWWDYTNNPFNIKGYVCLEFSIIWGLACVLVVDIIHPAIWSFVELIPLGVGWWLIGIFTLLIAADAVITLTVLLKLPKRFKAVEELERLLTAVSDGVGEKLFEGYERGRERGEAFEERHPLLHERSVEAVQEFADKRSRINNELKSREDERRVKREQRIHELEQKITETLGDNPIYTRIARAYPSLSEGKHSGSHFKRFLERAERTAQEKKQAKKAGKSVKPQE